MYGGASIQQHDVRDYQKELNLCHTHELQHRCLVVIQSGRQALGRLLPITCYLSGDVQIQSRYLKYTAINSKSLSEIHGYIHYIPRALGLAQRVACGPPQIMRGGRIAEGQWASIQDQAYPDRPARRCTPAAEEFAREPRSLHSPAPSFPLRALYARCAAIRPPPGVMVASADRHGGACPTTAPPSLTPHKTNRSQQLEPACVRRGTE
eukprot:354064-Chlamydomonas_euryale.AAC.9